MVLPTPLIDLYADAIRGNNGDAVATFPDMSGNGRDFTQATSADQPTLVVNAINGRQAVAFSNHYLANTSTGIAGQTSFTACLVMTVPSAAATARRGILAGGTTSDDWNQTNGNFAITNPEVTSETAWQSLLAAGSLTTANDVLILSSSRPYGTYAIVTIVAGVDGTALQTYANGAAETPVTGRTNTAVTLGGLFLGARYSGGAADTVDRGLFNLARLRLYSGRFTTPQLAELHSEMSDTFGIQLTSQSTTAGLYPTSNTTTGTTWASTTNANGSATGTTATFTTTTNGAQGVLLAAGYDVQTVIGAQPTSIDSVSCTINQYVTNNTARYSSVTAQLYSGSSTAIGSAQTLTLSTSTTNSQTLTFTGANAPTWAQCADLRVRLVGTKSGTQASVWNVDTVGPLTVTSTSTPPATTQTAEPFVVNSTALVRASSW